MKLAIDVVEANRSPTTEIAEVELRYEVVVPIRSHASTSSAVVEQSRDEADDIGLDSVVRPTE